MNRRAPIRLPLALLALSLVTGCATAVDGFPSASPESAGKNDGHQSGVVLYQERGSEGPFEFGGTPAYDACLVLPLADVVSAGVVLREDSNGQLVNRHQIAAGEHDPEQGGMSNNGMSTCSFPTEGANQLNLTIFQPPFDDPESKEQFEDIYSGNSSVDVTIVREETIAGQKVIVEGTDWGGWKIAFFGDDYYAILVVKVDEEGIRGSSPEEFRDSLATTVAQRLSEGPTPPARYSYTGEFAWVQPACTLYTGEDFEAAFGMPDIGRVEERHNIFVGVTTGSVQSGTQDNEPRRSVRTGCGRENEQAANSNVGSSSVAPQGLVASFEHFETEQGAAQYNNYNCDGDKKYNHPFGPPLKVPAEFSDIGDGHVCFISLGDVNPPFTFKVKQTVVELSSWNSDTYSDMRTALDVLEQPARNIAERLARL
ncbi:hypothetical protein AB8O38_06635 [Saccharomonospora xinjiangensis]|uniref:hypothetical protein n=1 Tax=Saccharomonospora xinjiangensis TaxID=75294 RepID=UPI00350EFDDE